MNTHVSSFPLAGMATAIRISAGFKPLGVQLMGPNQPFVFVEHLPEADSEVWEILVVPTGTPFPVEAQYLGTFPVLTEGPQNYIQVAGSPGMSNQPQMQVNIMHAYIRPCAFDAIPPELMESKA